MMNYSIASSTFQSNTFQSKHSFLKPTSKSSKSRCLNSVDENDNASNARNDSKLLRIPLLSRRRRSESPMSSLHMISQLKIEAAKRVRLNVSGTVFTATWGTLRRHPQTRLGKLNELNNNYCQETNEFFFERPADIFRAILAYYQTGELHLPKHTCPMMMLCELKFWGIPESAISHCCYTDFVMLKHQKNALEKFEKTFKNETIADKRMSNRKWRYRFSFQIWQALNDPTSSIVAKILAVISVIFILLSISIFCLETHPYFRPDFGGAHDLHFHDELEDNKQSFEPTSQPIKADKDPIFVTKLNDSNSHEQSLYNSALSANQSHTNETEDDHEDEKGTQKPDPKKEARIRLNILDYMCIGYFTVEFLAKLTFAPMKLKFLTNKYTIIDVIALIPLYIELLLNYVRIFADFREIIFDILAFMQMARLLRLFHVLRRYESLRIFVYTIQSSLKEILILMLFLAIGVVVYATLIFYADDREVFRSIPHSFWWSVVTLTTIGYGDFVPKFGAGYAVGALCAITGVLLISFTVPIIVNNFLLYYSYLQAARNAHLRQPIREAKRASEEQSIYKGVKPNQTEKLVWKVGSRLAEQTLLISNGIGQQAPHATFDDDDLDITAA